jgi:hypothetical protein
VQRNHIPENMLYWFSFRVSRIIRMINENGVLRSLFVVFPQPFHAKIYALLVEEKNKEEGDQAATLIAALTAIGLVSVAVMITLFVVDWAGHADKTDWLGTFGDFFGGVLNPLLTFGTFIGLSITIILQRVQLHDARIQYQKNIDASNVQAFETSFFNLINLHNSIVEGLRFEPIILMPNAHQKDDDLKKSAGKPVEGREVFGAVLAAMNLGHERKKTPQEVYKEIQDRHNYVLGHYFRNLYQIIKLVDRHKNSAADGKRDVSFYRGIIRAQLSSNELLLLFYNCQKGKMDSDKFLELVKEYEMLEHLPLLIMRSKNGLYVPNFGPFERELYWPFLVVSKDDSSKVISTGAFGKNKVILEFLSEKAALVPVPA